MNLHICWIFFFKVFSLRFHCWRERLKSTSFVQRSVVFQSFLTPLCDQNANPERVAVTVNYRRRPCVVACAGKKKKPCTRRMRALFAGCTQGPVMSRVSHSSQKRCGFLLPPRHPVLLKPVAGQNFSSSPVSKLPSSEPCCSGSICCGCPILAPGLERLCSCPSAGGILREAAWIPALTTPFNTFY